MKSKGSFVVFEKALRGEHCWAAVAPRLPVSVGAGGGEVFRNPVVVGGFGNGDRFCNYL